MFKNYCKKCKFPKYNVILGKKNIVLYGDGYIKDDILGFKFNISPMSFIK